MHHFDHVHVSNSNFLHASKDCPECETHVQLSVQHLHGHRLKVGKTDLLQSYPELC